jgi:hypothetical protein
LATLCRCNKLSRSYAEIGGSREQERRSVSFSTSRQSIGGIVFGNSMKNCLSAAPPAKFRIGSRYCSALCSGRPLLRKGAERNAQKEGFFGDLFRCFVTPGTPLLSMRCLLLRFRCSVPFLQSSHWFRRLFSVTLSIIRFSESLQRLLALRGDAPFAERCFYEFFSLERLKQSIHAAF